MGNNKTKLNLDNAFPNIVNYQRKDILSNFSKGELQLLFRLFLNLKSRSVEDGVDKVTFHHFCQLPGMWGQRFWTKFLRGAVREYIEFDEFVYSIYLCCRAPKDQQDKFIFELFNLGQKPNTPQRKEITREEVICMIYNMPKQGVIYSKKEKIKSVKDNDGKEIEWHGFHIEMNNDKDNQVKLMIGEKRYYHILPPQMQMIVDKMLIDVQKNEKLDFPAFQKFLDRNPALRQIIQESLKPQLWTINEKSNPHNYVPPAQKRDYDINTEDNQNSAQKPSDSKSSMSKQQHKRGGSFSCLSKQRSTQYLTGNDEEENLEGYLLKVGRKYDVFINRFYELRNKSLLCYKDASSKVPTDVLYLDGLYVEQYWWKGVKGFRLTHDSDYFKQKTFYSKNMEQIDKWTNAVRNAARCFDIQKRYTQLQALGKGKFSTVYLCQTQEGDEYVAMKHIDKKQLTSREREFLREEIQIIKSISHPNVVEMKDSFETQQFMYIMMECIQGGELFDHIKDYDITEKEGAVIVSQVLEALQYLHLCGIVHRDLKPENILIELDEQTKEVQHIKLTDFGLSKIIMPGESMFDSCGTPAYVAPEVLSKKGYYKEVDIWSTGVILYTMLARALPFHSSDRKKTFKLIKEADPDLECDPWHTISNECKDLIRKMLIKDPKERISVDDALKHPWFIKYSDHLKDVKEKYHPVIDPRTGFVKKNIRTQSLITFSQLQSNSDYNQQVEESGDGESKFKLPQSIQSRKTGSKNFDQRQHHEEKFQNDDDDSYDDDIKDINSKQKTGKKGRLDELFADKPKGGKQTGIQHHEVSRTFQPIKGFDLGLLAEQDKKEEEEKHSPQKRNANFGGILKTCRFFSDLVDDDHEDLF